MVSLLLCIGQLPALHGDTHCAFAFWVGMGPETQLKILHLCASCPTLDTLAVFRDPKNWKGYVEGAPFQNQFPSSRLLIDEWVAVLEYLNEISCDWGLLERYPTAMFSSGQQHEIWIFSRNKVVCAAGGGVDG